MDNGGTKWFQIKNDYDIKTETRKKVVDGVKYFKMGSIMWLTNLDHGRRHQTLPLMTMSENLKYSRNLQGKQAYDCYDNYDAIEVSTYKEIPSDYDGVMGVPITFLDKYNPEQFEIVGTTESHDPGNAYRARFYISQECRDAYQDRFGKEGVYDLNASGVDHRSDPPGPADFFNGGLPLEFSRRGRQPLADSMKLTIPLVALSLVANLSAAEVPKVFAGLFEQDVPVKGQIGVVLPPPEIDKYVAKVETAARKDPKWFREFSGSSKPGLPLPYDTRLGLTEAEYAEYLVLWNKREFKAMEDVMLLLRQTAGDTWSITSTGGASAFSTLRYDARGDFFRSPNGQLKRIDDIKADSSSILGEWTGMEWKFEEETGLGKTKENFALGRFADNKFGLIVYRAQELSTEGTRLLDKSLVVRFALGKGSQAKDPASGSKAPAKPASKKK